MMAIAAVSASGGLYIPRHRNENNTFLYEERILMMDFGSLFGLPFNMKYVVK